MAYMQRKKYTIDLAGHMAECEANYARLMQLLPNIDRVDQYQFGIELAAEVPALFQIEITERCKYTTMLDIRQQLPVASSSSTVNTSLGLSPFFSLRVYHDAQMAEVIAFNNHQRLRPSYEYPNDKMYHRDEKAQLNTLLGEWLSHCLQHGHVLDNPLEVFQ
jgi:uncharacterized protein YqiB (DUF1249 family)